MGDFNGKGEYNSEALNNLPTGYLNQIDNMLSKSIINFYDSVTWLDTYDIDITNKDGETILLVVLNKKNVIIEYNPKLFYFRYLPLSYSQKNSFIKQLFKKHFEDKINSTLESSEEIEIDFQNVNYTVGELTDDLYL